MERIKKEIKLIYTTGFTSGATSTNKYERYRLVPDTGITYNFNILLTKNNFDLGVYDSIDNSINNDGNLLRQISGYTITGITSNSRLYEIKKRSASPVFYKNYFYSINNTANGLDIYSSTFYTGNTLNNPIPILNISGITGITGYNLIYYIDGIKYNEISGFTSGITYSFVSNGYNTSDFVSNNVYKNDNLIGINQIGNISSDLFISRQELSVFEQNFNLEFVRNISDLESFAGGKYFNIIKNA